MKRLTTLKTPLIAFVLSVGLRVLAQDQAVATSSVSLPAAQLPATFEVATIKPSAPRGGLLGFYSYPGGRVRLGHATLRTVISYAFDLEECRIDGGPAWTRTDRYEITALPPESSESRKINQVEEGTIPTGEQQQMLQFFLRDRFNLQFHFEKRVEPVYLLVRGKGELAMQPAADKTLSPRGGVITRPNGIADGEAFGRNMSMALFAQQLSPDLERPVLDETGLSGSFDFHVPPSDPENRDKVTGIIGAMSHLGLQLKGATRPVETLVIDSVTRPTEN